MDRETLEWLFVRLLGMAHRCADQSNRRHLMGMANELVDLIEVRKQGEEIAREQPH